MCALEQTGVDLVAQNGSQFNSAIKSAQSSVQSLIGTAQAGTSNLSGFNVISGALAVTIGNLLTRAIEAGASTIADISKEAVMSAARFNTMLTAAEFLGEGVGVSKSKIDAMVESLQKLGIEDVVASDAVSQFSRYNLDLSKTVDLARVAQNASILTGQSVSATYEQMIYSIENANQRGLRQAGIFADVAKAERELAASLGIAVTDLTEENKVQAALNATLEAGTRIQGLYNKSSRDASVILSNLPTAVGELLDKMGQPFQRAFGTGLKAISDLVTGATTAFSPGGVLFPAITALGSNIDGLINNFVDLATSAVNSTGIMSGNVSQNLVSLANNAFSWGYALIDNFGSGMIQGAVAVINALTYIGNIISSMLESHSPPKLLPNLDKWGAGAMKAYMAGWGKADFGVFDEIAGTIESSLRAAAGTKDKGLIPRIIGDRTVIADALGAVRSAGEVTDQILTSLYAKTKTTDTAMRDYLKTTLELAVANDKVKVAQDALNAITKKYDDILSPLQAKQNASSAAADNMDDTRKISQLQMVLNDVNATAADKERAKLEIQKLQTGMQIRNIEQQKAAETDAAQTALDNATAQRDAVLAQQEAAKALVEEHTKENELLKQQKALLEELAKAAAALAKAGGGGGGGGIKIPTPPIPGLGGKGGPGSLFDIKNGDKTGGLGGLTIANPFGGIKQSITDLTTAIGNFNKAWAPATTASKPFFDWISKNLPTITKFATVFLLVAGVLAAIVGIVAAVGGALLGLTNPVTVIILVVALAAAIWATWGGVITKWVTDTQMKLLHWSQGVQATINQWETDTSKKIGDWVTNTWKSFTDWVTNVDKTVTDWVNTTGASFQGWVNDVEGKISSWAAGAWASFLGWSANVGKTVADWSTNASKTISDWIKSVGKQISDWAGAAYDSAVSWAENIVKGLTDGLAAKWEQFKKYFSGLVADMPDWVKKLLGISSPSKVFAEIGANMMAGWAKGLIDNAHLVKNAAQISLGGIVNGVGGAGTVSHMSSSYHYNPVYQLTMQTVQQPRSVQSSFEMMQILGGG